MHDSIVTSGSKHRLFRLHFWFILSPVIGGDAVWLEAHPAPVVQSDIYLLQMATKDGRSI